MLEGDACYNPTTSTILNLIDELNGVALAEYNDNQVFFLSSMLCDTEISTWSDYCASSGGARGAPATPYIPHAIDGDDMSLGYEIITGFDTILIPMFLSSFPTYEKVDLGGTVFADGTIAYIQILSYGDKVRVVSQKEDVTTIL